MALIIVSGPSGVGKDFLVRQLVHSGIVQACVPLTTRTPRLAEVAGTDYQFLGIQAFQELISLGRLFEWDYVLGSYYGYPERLCDELRSGHVAVHMLSRMALRVKSRLGDDCRLIFLRSDQVQLRARLEKRGCAEAEMLSRIELLEEEVTHSVLFDLVVDGEHDKADGLLATRILNSL